MSNKNPEPTENRNEKDKKQDDSVKICTKDVPIHIDDTEDGNAKRDKKEKDTTQDNLDEIKISCSDKDVSINKVEPVRRSRRTVIYVYLCPRFTFNLFSRAQNQHARTQSQAQRRRRFGFAEGRYTVFRVSSAKAKGLPIEYYYEHDNEHNMGAEEEEEGDRNYFIRKVFTICAIMLVVTVCLTILAATIPPISAFLNTRKAVYLLPVFILGTLIVQYSYCCSNCSRIFPINYSLNIFVTICFSYITSFMSARYAPLIVISAAGITLVTALVILGLAYTSFDFTRFILPFTIALLSFLAATVICTALVYLFNLQLNVHRMILLIFSSVSSSTMMVVEIQMILGGNSVEIGEEDFTFGAYMVFNSLVNIFLKVLGVINFAGGGDDTYEG